MFLFLLSKENLPLARAEAERLHRARGELIDDCLLLDVPTFTEGLAFTRAIHEVLARGENTAPEELLARLDYGSIEPPFRVRASGDASGLDEKALAGVVWRGLEAAGRKPSVDLKGPKTDIHVIVKKMKNVNDENNDDNDAVFITKSLFTNPERFSERRSHLRPANHPTSLAPKLARAMLNLAGPAETILDPFCGSGGILLEGCLAGREMTGTDLDERQIRRAEENLAHYGCAATLSVADARKCGSLGRFDAIVTDLPYGKNSKLDGEKETFERFFSAASKTAKTMVVAADEKQAIEKLIPAQWAIIHSFSWYLHRSLTKRILVLALAEVRTAA